MGSTFSSPLGGVSKTFPIGTFVIVPRHLTDQEISDAAIDENSQKWCFKMNETVGKIGIVLGGSQLPERNIAIVAFMIPESKLGNYFSYESSWLKAVPEQNVPKEEFLWLRKYMRNEMLLLLQHEHKIQLYNEKSKLGSLGTFVRVNRSYGTPAHWSIDMSPTMNKIGVVFGADCANNTMVVFPEPIYNNFVYNNSELTKIESIDDVGMFVSEFDALNNLKKLVLEVFDPDTLPANMGRGSESENVKDSESDSMNLNQRVKALELKVKQLESYIVALPSEKKL